MVLSAQYEGRTLKQVVQGSRLATRLEAVGGPVVALRGRWGPEARQAAEAQVQVEQAVS